MSYENELKLHSGTASVTLTVDANGNLLINGGKVSTPTASLDASGLLQLTQIPTVVGLDGLSVVNNLFTTGINNTSVNTSGTSRHVYTVGAAASGVRLIFSNSTTNSSQVDVPNAGGAISFSASVEDSTGTIYRVTFGGRTTATLDPGGVITSDMVAIELVAGTTIATRTFLVSGTAWATRSTVGTASSGGFVTTTDLTAPGASAVTPSFGFSYGPSAVISIPAPGAIALYVQGTSIEIGTGDGSLGGSGQNVPDARWYSGGGYCQQAMSGVGGCVVSSNGGDTAQGYVANAGHFIRQVWSLYANNALICYGINDLSAGRTPAQLQADLLSIATRNLRYGIKRNFLVTVTPVTTSATGLWSTLVDQTLASWNLARVTHNGWVRDGCPLNSQTLVAVAAGTAGALRAGSAGHPITGYVELADQVESSRDSGKWKIPNRIVTDLGISGSSANIASATANLVNSLIPTGDLATTFAIAGAGAAGVPFFSQLVSRSSGTAGILVSTATTTVSNATAAIGVKTIDGTHPSTDSHALMKNAIIASVFATG